MLYIIVNHNSKRNEAPISYNNLTKSYNFKLYKLANIKKILAD